MTAVKPFAGSIYSLMWMGTTGLLQGTRRTIARNVTRPSIWLEIREKNDAGYIT